MNFLLAGTTLLCCCHALAASAGSWQEALRGMSLPPKAPLLNRDNAASVILHGFQSNATVKAILILPEVADDFYLIHRDAPKLDLRATNLLDAVVGLTNRTALRLTWQEPFILLHLASDRMDASLRVADGATATRLRRDTAVPHGVFVDLHWEKLQPKLASALRCEVRPAPDSSDAWHFGRHNFAGWNLTGWEFLTATALTGNTTVTIQKQAILAEERRP